MFNKIHLLVCFFLLGCSTGEISKKSIFDELQSDYNEAKDLRRLVVFSGLEEPKNLQFPKNLSFPDEIEFKYTTGQKVTAFAYCPDNTCDVLEFLQPLGSEYAKFLVWTYLYFDSSYYFLKEWRLKFKKEDVESVAWCKNVGKSKVQSQSKTIKIPYGDCFRAKYVIKFYRIDRG